eukprot:108641_1
MFSYITKRTESTFIRHIKRYCTTGHVVDNKLLQINNELHLALQHLPRTVPGAIPMCNPSYLDTNFLHKGIHKRPQYTCGYSNNLDIISIYFRHSDPTYSDTITDLNIKHREIQLNNNSMNVHAGFMSYLTAPDNEFIDNITSQLKLLKNTYQYDTSQESKTRLLVTGQSLGSALSQLFYLLIYTDCEYYENKLKDLIPSNLENVYVITFGSPSFIYWKDVEKYFKNINEYQLFYELSQRIYNFHDENDPIPLLLTGLNQHLQTEKVSFREVVKCSLDRKLSIASNQHIGNNYALLENKCINMEHDHTICNEYLINGANCLWNNKCANSMRHLLTLFAKNHFPHHYKLRLQQFLEKS